MAVVIGALAKGAQRNPSEIEIAIKFNSKYHRYLNLIPAVQIAHEKSVLFHGQGAPIVERVYSGYGLIPRGK